MKTMKTIQILHNSEQGAWNKFQPYTSREGDKEILMETKSTQRVISYDNSTKISTNNPTVNNVTLTSTSIVRRMDDLGRIVIPRDIRNLFGIKEGDELEIYTNDEGFIGFKKIQLI